MTEEPKTAEAARPKRKLSLGARMGRWAALNLLPPVAKKYLDLFNWTALKNNEELLTLLGHEELIARVEAHVPSIISLWHNRLIFGPTAYQYGHGRGAAVMVSRSFDGEIIAAVINRFKNFKAVRGSSSKHGVEKGGREALAEMIELGKQGWDLVITPDGPQGPRYQVKRGIIDLAKYTGFPIYPVAPNIAKYLEAKSWDRTRLPLPFYHFIYAAGKPISVPPGADETLIEQKRAELEKSMLELTEMVDHFFDKKEE